MGKVGVHATLALNVRYLCCFLAEHGGVDSCFLGLLVLAITTQILTMMVSPTISVVFLLRFGDCLAQELHLTRSQCTLIVVFGSNLCFAVPSANALLLICTEEGNYQKRRVRWFGCGIQVFLMSIVIAA